MGIVNHPLSDPDVLMDEVTFLLLPLVCWRFCPHPSTDREVSMGISKSHETYLY